jgi:hypothetical protein
LNDDFFKTCIVGDSAGYFLKFVKVLTEGESGGKNAIPSYGRKRIFADLVQSYFKNIAG